MSVVLLKTKYLAYELGKIINIQELNHMSLNYQHMLSTPLENRGLGVNALKG